VDGRGTTGAGLPVHGDQESNPSTDDAEAASAYQTIVNLQSVEEHDATAGLGLLGRNPETTKHGYVEGCRYIKEYSILKQTHSCIIFRL